MKSRQLKLVARGLAVVSMFIWTGAPGETHAQGVLATVSGTVTDESGAVVPGVTVTMVNLATNEARTVVTNEHGAYRVDGLRPSKYSLTAELQGFATVVRPEITVNVGAVLTIDVVLKVSTVQETVTVSGEAPMVQAEKADLSTVITKEQIENLPVNGRNYIDFALLTPTATPNVSTPRQGVFVDVGSARSYESQLLVDGFWNTDELFGAPRHLYSQDAVQEFQVVASGATAEYGRAIGGIISAVTKSGANSVRGSAFGYFRNKQLNSKTVFERLQNLPKAEFNRKQFGGTVGGPIRRDRTFFFGSVERSDENTPVNNLITPENARIIGLPPEDAGTIKNFRRILFWMGKIDHNLSKAQRLNVNLVYTHHENFGQRNETFATRSRQTHQDLRDLSVQAGWQYVRGAWLHDLRGAYFPRKNETIGFNLGGPPLVPEGQMDQFRVPRVTITNVASFGASNINNRQRTYPVQVVYASSLFARRHSVKFGADVMDTEFDYYLFTGRTGTYTFRDLPNFLAGRYATYTQQFGDPRIQRHHTYLSGYVQDSWSATDRLTVNYGLRYDLEIHPKYKGRSFGHDDNNVGPRVSLSYDLTGERRRFLKASAGLYYDRLFLNLSTQPFYNFKEDPQLFSATWQFGQLGAPSYPNNFSELPANAPRGIRDVWLFPDPLKTPASVQVVGIYESALGATWAFSATVLYTRTWDQVFRLDRNLSFDEALHRWVRPDPNYRAINQWVFVGRAEYAGLVLELRRRLSNRLSLTGNVTLARSYDTATGFFDQASDQRFFDQEWGPSSDKPRMRGVVSWIYQITDFLTFAGIYSGRSGLAYDPRVGPAIDLNGDGQFNDRAPGFRRNAFRGPGAHTVDMRLAWSVPLPNARRMQLLLEGFNVLDRDNVVQVSNIYGPTPGQPLPLFGQPTAYGSPRQIQLGVRLEY